MRPIKATLRVGALANNLEVARRHAGAARIWAVAKADAYGHGLQRLLPGLNGADGLALLELDAALQLRKAGYGKPILMLEGWFGADELDSFSRQHLTAVVHGREQLEMLERASLTAPVNVYCKVNTGMNRLGFAPADAGIALERLRKCANAGEVTLMTHFADADGARGVTEAMKSVTDLERSLGPGRSFTRSYANSAAILRFPETHADWVRPGIMLYGCTPFGDAPLQPAAGFGLQPVMTLASRIIAVQHMKAGERIGYGGVYTASETMRVGIIACGYADGYPRHAPGNNAHGTPVLVAGQRTRTVGRVSMDMIFADITQLPQAQVGSEVTLWGEGLSADEVALAAGTVSYELLCGLTRRVPVEVISLVAKPKTVYTCTECGGATPKWQGQCPACNAWNTLVESVAEAAAGTRHRFAGIAAASKIQKLSEVSARDAPRLPTGNAEFDRVLGGGLVAGQVVLIGGDPGVGKSTLLLQSLADMGTRMSALYVSGEESAEQVALRAHRLALGSQGMDGLDILAEIQLERIIAALDGAKPAIAVIDSIQTLYSEALTSAPGSVAQVRECAAQLTRFAKQSGTIIVLVGHVTKEGALAGPRVLEHIVDTVLYFEGDTHQSFRLIRAFKNRFGAVNELGVFAMTDKGLKGVSNPSAIFLSTHEKNVPGSCVLVTQEGTRPLLVEVQALVDAAHAPNPRRLSVGLEQNRLAMLLAVLHRHGGIACYDQDVFVNAVGGVRITEPAADLAVLLAVVSSLTNRPLPGKLAVFGEVGLAGEVRPAPRGQDRLREAAKLGFERVILPAANKPRQAVPGVEVLAVSRVSEAIGLLKDLAEG